MNLFSEERNVEKEGVKQVKRLSKLFSVFSVCFLLSAIIGFSQVSTVKAQEKFVFSHVDAEVDVTSGKLVLYRWNREGSLSIDLPLAMQSSESLTEQEGVKFQSDIVDVLIYKLGEKSIEYEIILKAKLPSNAYAFPISTKDLKFYYQPPLDEELNVTEYDFVNATHAIINGTVQTYRPENVVGSYAVYQSSFG